MNEEYQVNDKVVLMCPIDVYVDVFTMTGNIVSIELFEEDSNKKIFLYSIKLDDPTILTAPELWKENEEYICKVTKDFIVPIKDLEPSHLKWINKGKEMLVNTNCFEGSLRFLDEIIYGLQNNQANVSAQAICQFNISWMEDILANEQFELIKLMVYDTKISIKKCIREIKKLRDFIKNKQLMVN